MSLVLEINPTLEGIVKRISSPKGDLRLHECCALGAAGYLLLPTLPTKGPIDQDLRTKWVEEEEYVGMPFVQKLRQILESETTRSSVGEFQSCLRLLPKGNRFDGVRRKLYELLGEAVMRQHWNEATHGNLAPYVKDAPVL